MQIGRIFISEDGIGISNVTLIDEQEEGILKRDYTLKETAIIKETALQLNEYFDGKRREFSVKINPQGTLFQKKVWEALLRIPYGQTRSYKDIAREVGNEKAARAVGMANHKNPIMCIIPCHRVIGSNGSLTGYAGGIGIKERLLRLENSVERKLYYV